MIVSSTKEEVKTKDTFVDSTDAFLVGPPSNCCKECAREHDPGQPHVLESLYYQLRFKQQHGRVPTEKDAMAHCSKAVKEEVRKQKEYERSLY